MSSKYRSFNVPDKIDASPCRLVCAEPGRGIKFASPRIIVNWEYRVNVLIKPNHFTDDPPGNHLHVVRYSFSSSAIVTINKSRILLQSC